MGSASGEAKLDLLRTVPLFAEMKQRALERLVDLVREIEAPDGYPLMRQGAPGDEMFIVVEGLVRVERDGRELALRGPGDLIGEIALVDRGPRSATVVALGPTRLLVIGRDQFIDLAREFPEVHLGVLKALAHRARRVDPDAY